ILQIAKAEPVADDADPGERFASTLGNDFAPMLACGLARVGAQDAVCRSAVVGMDVEPVLPGGNLVDRRSPDGERLPGPRFARLPHVAEPDVDRARAPRDAVEQPMAIAR